MSDVVIGLIVVTCVCMVSAVVSVVAATSLVGKLLAMEAERPSYIDHERACLMEPVDEGRETPKPVAPADSGRLGSSSTGLRPVV